MRSPFVTNYINVYQNLQKNLEQNIFGNWNIPRLIYANSDPNAELVLIPNNDFIWKPKESLIFMDVL